MEWQHDYDARSWEAIENWWRRSDDLAALSALLTQLQRDVPKRTLRNGVDEHQEFRKAKDAPKEWSGAAAILQYGELEAKIAGDPASDPEIWADQNARLTSELREFAALAEVTKGDMEFVCRRMIWNSRPDFGAMQFNCLHGSGHNQRIGRPQKR